ncbi:MAG: error-prone DNA polymerase [Spirochaetales bacterium]|nr:error-prone DNA polymerase [Spirochaetales bacterium]
MPTPAYSALWCKSNYSFLEGASHPEELIKTAADLGLKALALTDRNGVYGVVRAHEAAKQIPFPLIIGAELGVSPHYNLMLLATSRQGYANLCSLITLGHHQQPKGQFALTAAQMAAHLANKSPELVALWHPRVLGVDLSAELSPFAEVFHKSLYLVASRHRWVEDHRRERDVVRYAESFNLPIVAAPEVLYHTPARQELQDVMTSIRHGVRLAEAGTKLRPNAEHALKHPADFASLYNDRPQWVRTTLEITERCQFSLSEIQYLYPEEGVPDGYSTSGWVRHLTFQGARQRYPQGIPQQVKAQLEKELQIIEQLQYAGYFLTMWEIVEFCRQNGILCQGRGSAANSAVCYCLSITAIDPVAMDLLFERFLSLERNEPPDIDLDIEHNRREEVIQHMYAKYGRHRAAMVANVVRYRSRSALREVGKVLGFSEVDLDRSSKLLSHHDEGIVGATQDAGMDPDNPTNQRLFRLANQLRGFPRHLSIHPGGFLLGSEPLERIVPVEAATMKGRTIIQWDKVDVEAMNLFKVDLLGLGALTHLDYAFRLLKKAYRIDLDMAKIPAKDEKVFQMIQHADTVGVFQIESRAQMSMLPRLKPQTYYDLVVEISLVRPGPITGGMVHPYLRRRNGEEEVTYPHPCLKSVLAKTLGVPLFQEQVMKLAVVAADYTPGEADQLRRDMAAWKSTGRIEEHHERLVRGMLVKGIQPDFAERVFQQIKGFGEYGFPESHAASFALIAWATAWIKYHFPDVFACALLNAWPMGFYAPGTIMADAKRHGVPVRPVDLRFSDWECTLEDTKEGPFALRIGFCYIQGLMRSELEQILAVRRQGKAKTLADWKAQAQVSVATWERIAVAGALRSFDQNRRNILWAMLKDGPGDPLPLPEPPSHEFAKFGVEESVYWDHESTGFSPTAHLLACRRSQLESWGCRSAKDVAAMEKGSTRYVGVVICRQRPGNAKGVLFMTLEDETGTVNVVVWEKTWIKYRKVILTSFLIGVEGPVQNEQGVVHVMARRLWAPEGVLAPNGGPKHGHDFR